MSLKRANLSILLVAFVLASPLGGSWCDAACAPGTSGTHHNAPRPIYPALMADVHHEHHAAATQPTSAYLSGHTPKCETPRLDVVARVKPMKLISTANDQLPASLSAPCGETSHTGVRTAIASGSPPDTSPPILTALRI